MKHKAAFVRLFSRSINIETVKEEEEEEEEEMKRSQSQLTAAAAAEPSFHHRSHGTFPLYESSFPQLSKAQKNNNTRTSCE